MTGSQTHLWGAHRDHGGSDCLSCSLCCGTDPPLCVVLRPSESSLFSRRRSRFSRAQRARRTTAKSRRRRASAIVGQGKRICSWNVRRLGHDFDSKPKNIALVQKVISANCDLVAVQEVMQMSGNVVPGFDALADELGSTYAGGRSERRSRVPTRRARTPSGMPTSGASRRSRSATA